ncbi:hypothetical protein AURDEDRAFT_178530 [Auricularia subglabra TFB-10046 SS5]|uniref:Uncharacterized protein n=1 Tax=Auricularia subglabra (strain TFB-10046 / SS5) TaxID=717982 RepID=J0D1D2_AURST|nr:hypothetical protein AURDEDRAFT_178530 [Auricularia subglabra TFB-10046 SS5]
MRRRPQTASCISPSRAITFSASLGRRSDRLLDEFDGLFAPSPRAMSDMRDIAGASSHRTALILSQDPFFILGLYRLPRDPPRTISGAHLVPTFHLHGARSLPASRCPSLWCNAATLALWNPPPGAPTPPRWFRRVVGRAQPPPSPCTRYQRPRISAIQGRQIVRSLRGVAPPPSPTGDKRHVSAESSQGVALVSCAITASHLYKQDNWLLGTSYRRSNSCYTWDGSAIFHANIRADGAASDVDAIHRRAERVHDPLPSYRFVGR